MLLDRLRVDPARKPEAGTEEQSELGMASVQELLREIGEVLAGAGAGLEDADEAGFDEVDGDGDEEWLDLPPYRADRASALSDSSLFGHSTGGRLTRAAIQAYGALEPERPVHFGEFVQHHGEASNPLLELENPERFGFGTPWSPATEEVLEAVWTNGLRRVLHDFLLPHGGVHAGITGAGSLTIEITSIGRYLLGLASDFVLDAPASAATPVRVQPDFEVVFVASHPSLEAAISRFAERRGRGVGVLFRITRDSIVSAAQAGLGADEVLATLARASSTPVPTNVEHEIRAWSGRCRRIALEPALLLRCPDAETAARALATVGPGKLESLSETVLALLDPAQKVAVVRLCRKAGLFLTSTGEAAQEPRRGPRRRARWR